MVVYKDGGAAIVLESTSLNFGLLSEKEQVAVIAAYAAMISDLDGYVGRVMSALEKAGVVDNTLVIFTSDNGATHEGPHGTNFHIGGADPKFFNSTADLRGYKGSVYEGGIRVPMIARLPHAFAVKHPRCPALHRSAQSR